MIGNLVGKVNTGVVSMKSGLEDRNNNSDQGCATHRYHRLNEVRPGRPEQWWIAKDEYHDLNKVSMKSGLEDRNNCPHA